MRTSLESMLLLAAGFSLLAGCRSVQPSPRPNVLFIAVDDLRPELGCYGSRLVRSPRIDALAASGVTFTRAYCQLAACNGSRASLMSGLRPDTLKVWNLSTDFRTTRPDAVTLPQHLKAGGYHAVGIGKIYHNVLPDPASWSEPKLQIDGYPFDPDAVYRDPQNVEWLGRRRGELTRMGREKRYVDRFGKWYLKHVATESPDVPDDAYFDGAQTTVAIDKMRGLADRSQPFFMAVGYYRPHLPFNVPRRYWDLYDRDEIPLAGDRRVTEGAPPMAINTMRELRGYTDFKTAATPLQGSLTDDQARLLRHGYLASVSYVDAQVGRLLDALEQLGLRENTVVVLWGDHGWKLGEHNSWCKMTNYEIDNRVPLIVSAPGAPANGRSCASLVELVDVYPTICDLAGLPPRREWEGLSFKPLLVDSERTWKSAAFSQFLREGIWVAPDGVEYMGRALRTDRFRYVEWRRWQQSEVVARELYDLRRDPWEERNIAVDPANADLIAALGAKLHAGWRQALPPGYQVAEDGITSESR